MQKIYVATFLATENQQDQVRLSEQIKTNNSIIRNLTGEWKKIEPDCREGVRAQLERMKELCKERNNLYEKLDEKSFINKSAPFQAYDGTGETELVESLNIVSEYVFDKYLGDAFTNEKLVDFLKPQNIDKIEVVGIGWEQRIDIFPC